MKKILLIITGSIAAYKNIDLIKHLEKDGYIVTIILTNSARNFISETAILSISSKCKIYSDDIFQDTMLHINLARSNSIILVAPASANFIAKVASGLASSLSLAVILAAKTKVIFCPAMNPAMYDNQATQENITKLKARNYEFLGPEYGLMACNEEGYGRYINTKEIITYITKPAIKQLGKKAVILLGSTRENIDPVRYIGNYSSGETGVLIAEELKKLGFEVKIIAGSVTTTLPQAKRAYCAKTMLESALSELPADIVICLAAICDFKPINVSQQKIKKDDDIITLKFKKNIDVITEISNNPQRPRMLVGFALESDDYNQHALNKLERKNLDAIVLNKVSYLGHSSNQYSIFTKNEQIDLGLITKTKLSQKLVNFIYKNIEQII